jgi:Lon protease-like protein
MAEGAATDVSGQLPPTLPIFPLPGVLLLPGGRLPLNIFEPRYLAMTRDAMATHRMIGMVQPLNPDHKEWDPAVYQSGCAGRVTSFNEQQDGRYHIVLTGLSRFRIAQELTVTTLYRQVVADWQPYRVDMDGDSVDAFNRGALLAELRAYLEIHGITAEWKTIEQAPTAALINSLSMICPFAPSEKQALLEARDTCERGNVMTALIKMAVLSRRTAGNDDKPNKPLH